ncbi:hypothetical protein EV182_000784 [Spiromyces aspiralis]|uniref:Uncharacterized protein n=1 Tax=Spiromyces aspiralis TaxID=68401 RepID=A0ACC1HU09_9FUNG|nr:hypothetical protein EV182_000784 [Spiromyces aspiralis]
MLKCIGILHTPTSAANSNSPKAQPAQTMNITQLVSAIAVVSTNPSLRPNLLPLLQQLRGAVHSITANPGLHNAELVTLLNQTTLGLAHPLSAPIARHLSDKERETSLDCLLAVLTTRLPSASQDPDSGLTQRKPFKRVHVAVIERLCKTLTPLFAYEAHSPVSQSATTTSSSGGDGGAFAEHTRLLALKCWKELIQRVDAVVIPTSAGPGHEPQQVVALYDFLGSASMRNYMAFNVCSLLDNASFPVNGSGELQREALDTLDAVILGDRDDRQRTRILGSADRLRPLFPGIASSLTKLSLGRIGPSTTKGESQVVEWTGDKGAKTSAQIQAKALRVLAKVIEIVMGDAANLEVAGEAQDRQQRRGWEGAERGKLAERAKELLVDKSQSDYDAEPTAMGLPTEDKQSRTSEASWVETARERIRQVLKMLSELRLDPDTRVRTELLNLCHLVVTECRLVLEECVGMAIEISLLTASLAATPQRDAVIEGLRDICRRDEQVRHTVQDRFEATWSNHFSMMINHGEDQKRRDILVVLTGYMQVISGGENEGSSIVMSIWDSVIVPSLLKALHASNAKEQDVPTGTVVSNMDADATAALAGLTFDAFRGDELAHVLEEFVDELLGPAMLGWARGCQLLVSVLHNPLYREYQPQVLWLINRVVSQFSDSGGDVSLSMPTTIAAEGVGASEEIEPIAQELFEECTNALSVASAPPMQSPAGPAATPNHLQTALTLECLVKLVPIVGGQSILYLLDSLMFPLLKLAMQPSPAVRYWAMQVIRTLSVACDIGSGEIAPFLVYNIDYIVQSCSIQLYHLASGAMDDGEAEDLSVFEVMSAMLLLGGNDMLVYMEDVIDAVLDVCESRASASGAARVLCRALDFIEVFTRRVLEWDFGGGTLAEIEDGYKHGRLLLKHQDSDSHNGHDKQLRQIEGGDTGPRPSPVVGGLDRSGAGADEIEQFIREYYNHLRQQEQEQLEEKAAYVMPRRLSAAEFGQLFEENDQQQEVDLDDAKGKPPPLTQTQALDMRVGLIVHHFMSSSNERAQRTTLQIIQNILPVLHATDKELLQYINEVWPTLCHRLELSRQTIDSLIVESGPARQWQHEETESVYVTLAACQTIRSVCLWGGDWMRQRIRDDALPVIQANLRQLTRPEYTATNGPLNRIGGIRGSSIVRLADELMRLLGVVVESGIPLRDDDAWQAVWLVVPFLDQRSLRPEVVEAAKLCLEKFGAHGYADKVWLVLQVIGSSGGEEREQVFIPPAAGQGEDEDRGGRWSLPELVLSSDEVTPKWVRTLIPRHCGKVVDELLLKVS